MSATIAGAPTGALSRFPYARTAPDGHCELCHRASGLLLEITVTPPRGGRLRRTVRACPRHARGSEAISMAFGGAGGAQPLQDDRLFEVPA